MEKGLRSEDRRGRFFEDCLDWHSLLRDFDQLVRRKYTIEVQHAKS